MRCPSPRATEANQRSLRVCILGAGAITEAGHLPGYLAAGAELAAVADLDRDRVEDLADRFPIGSVYTDWREMLAVERPDVVSVCLPNRLHEEATLAALESGAHVLCEKPLAPNAGAAARMFAAAREHGRHLMAAQQYRWDAGTVAAKAAIDAGVVGDIRHAEARWLRRVLVPRSRLAADGGVLLDLGVHALDQAMWLMGNPRPLSVSAMSATLFAEAPGPSGDRRADSPASGMVDDLTVALVRFDGGATLLLRTSWAINADVNDARPSTVVLGTDCGVVHRPPSGAPRPRRTPRDRGTRGRGAT